MLDDIMIVLRIANLRYPEKLDDFRLGHQLKAVVTNSCRYRPMYVLLLRIELAI